MRVPELQRILVEAAQREDALAAAALARPERTTGQLGTGGGAWTSRRRRWSGLQSSRWRALPVLALLLLGGTAAAFASGLISFGTPAASVPVLLNPQAGLGRITPGTVRLLPLSVPDPRGGPPWGMRVLRTTRGAGCLQVGRLLDGKLVALGQDGAFDDDGRAHELPVSSSIERLDCSLVDAHSRIFQSVTLKSQAASAAGGMHCRPPGTYAPTSHAVPRECPLADERNLYYGMLGPNATSLTYTSNGKTRTVRTVGDDGAYLLVTTGTTHLYTGARGRLERAGLATSDIVPVYSPIIAIHYRGGATCHLVTAERWIYGPTACVPALPEPFGYVKAHLPTRSQLATPIHTRLIRRADSRWEIRVRFASRVAISSLRGEYLLTWHDPGTPANAKSVQTVDVGPLPRAEIMIPQGRNIAAGQTLTTTIEGFSPASHPLPGGILSGSVILDYAAGPLMQTAEDTTKIPVGSFTVRVPPSTPSRARIGGDAHQLGLPHVTKHLR